MFLDPFGRDRGYFKALGQRLRRRGNVGTMLAEIYGQGRPEMSYVDAHGRLVHQLQMRVGRDGRLELD